MRKLSSRTTLGFDVLKFLFLSLSFFFMLTTFISFDADTFRISLLSGKAADTALRSLFMFSIMIWVDILADVSRVNWEGAHKRKLIRLTAGFVIVFASLGGAFSEGVVMLMEKFKIFDAALLVLATLFVLCAFTDLLETFARIYRTQNNISEAKKARQKK
jgi:hypothetical protein